MRPSNFFVFVLHMFDLVVLCLHMLDKLIKSFDTTLSVIQLCMVEVIRQIRSKGYAISDQTNSVERVCNK